MVKVKWTAENDRKLLLQLIVPTTKDIPFDDIAKLFPGATTKSIEERIAKLRREKKAGTSTGTTPNTTPTKPASTKAAQTKTSPPAAKTVTDPLWVGGSQNPRSKTTEHPYLTPTKGRKRMGTKVEKDDDKGLKKVKVETVDDDDEIEYEDNEEGSPEVKDEDLDDGDAL